jgi:3-deoxy-manno-octulosonate cytidylyltransferase (CMP-KDO synthetase)
MPLKTCIIIPARYDSKRFPGKPVNAVIAGQSLIQRVWRIASCAASSEDVYVATDNDIIARHVEGFGGRVVMTPSDVATGTDRVHAALQRLPADYQAVVNLQGDAPLTPPWVVRALMDEISREDGPPIATPAVLLSDEQLEAFEESKVASPSSGTTVVMSASHRALYFSKLVMPFRRDNYPARVYRHVGLYAYRRDALAHLVTIPPTMLEQSEGLEQLRALESDIAIQVVEVDYRGRTHHSIDHPNDVPIAETIIYAEGELEDMDATN